MADNTQLNASTTVGDVMATDDIGGGVKVQREKVGFGVDGSYADVSAGNPLPVAQTGALPVGDNNIGNVDVLTLPSLPAGANNIGDVDVLTLPTVTINPLPTGTNNIGDVDVLTLPADPLGANADAVVAAGAAGSISAKLRRTTQGLEDLKTGIVLATGANAIGSVSISSITPGTGQNNLGKAEDTAHGSNDVGVMALAVRQDTPAALAADGEYIPLTTDSTGALRVTGGGGGTQFAEDTAHTTGDAGTMALAVRRDANTSLVGTDGDYAPLQVNADGSLKVVITSGGSAGAQFAEDAAHVSGDQGTMALAVRRDANTSLVGTDGDYAPLQVDATGNLKVAIISGAGSGGTALQDGAVFTPDTTNFTPVGGYRDDTSPAAVTEGDGAGARITEFRALHVNLRTAAGAEITPATKTVDDVAGTDVGMVSLVVRDDALATLTPVDGDYTQLRVTSVGRLWTSATIDAALPAGTNNIGDVDVLTLPALPAGTNNIGDVDVLTMPGAFAEDAAHASGNTGHLALVVRRDANTSLVDTDGDYAPLQVDATGSLKVAIISGGSGGTQFAEDAAHVSGDLGTMALAVRRDANTSLVGTDGDYAPLQVDANGALKVNIVAGAGSGGTASVDDSAFTIAAGSGTPIMGLAAVDSVDSGDVGVVAMTTARALHVAVQSMPGIFAEDAAHTTADNGMLILGVRQDTDASPVGANGDYHALQFSANGLLKVEVRGSSVGAGAPAVQGATAHDGAITSFPVLIGARASANEPAAVSADNDVTNLWADLFGRLVVMPGHPNPEAPVTVNATASGTTSVIGAPGASLSLYILKGSVHNRASTNRVVDLRDGSAGTVRWRIEAAAEGGGSLFDFGARGWKLTANTALFTNLDAAGDVDINITEYYIAA